MQPSVATALAAARTFEVATLDVSIVAHTRADADGVSAGLRTRTECSPAYEAACVRHWKMGGLIGIDPSVDEAVLEQTDRA